MKTLSHGFGWLRCLMFVFVLGLSAAASAAITVTIVKPVASGVVDRYPVPVYPVMTLVATVQSTYEITSVTGTLAGKSVALTFSQSAYRCSMSIMCPAWTAKLDLTGVAQGTYELVITAKDVLGGSAVATSSVTFDPSPTIAVQKPVPYSVATPLVELDLSCVDDVAGCTVSVRNAAGVVVLTGTGSAVGTVDLTSYVGQTTSLTVTATDSVGQTATKTLSIPVVDVARLALQASVPGRIFDVAGDRILYLDDTVEPQLLKIRNRATGADTTIYSVAGGKPITGYLHPNGAMFIDQPGDVLTTRLFDWRNGAIVAISGGYQSNGFIVRGKYAIYHSSGGYMLRDLTTGVDQLIASNIPVNDNSLAVNGTVAYWKSLPNGCSSCTYAYDYEIFLWKNGSSTQITRGGGLWSIYPVTDGINVVFKRKPNPGATSTQTQQIILWNGSQEIVLSDGGDNYAIANGYVAFTKPGTSGQLQVLRRLPSGTLEQLTFFSVGSQIDTISDTGTVTLINSGKLYVYEVGGTLVELGTSLEKRFWLNGELYGVVGGSVFKIDRAATQNPVTTTTAVPTTTTAATTTSTALRTTTTVAPTTTTALRTTTTVAPTTTTTSGTALRTTTTAAPTTTSTVATTTSTTQVARVGWSVLDSTTPGTPGDTLTLTAGWNLLGNGWNQSLPVASVFGDAARVTTVWKWDVAKSGWQFYSPTMTTQELQTYAAGKSFGVLSAVGAGEGFWVNIKQPFTVTLPNGTVVRGVDFQSGGARAPAAGWNLIAIGEALKANGFNSALSTSPPVASVVPQNLTTLWAWDNAESKWYFYSPQLDAKGGTVLTDYIASKGYLDFTVANRLLLPGTGFWVNKP